jgi:uncharacterized membrane protein
MKENNMKISKTVMTAGALSLFIAGAALVAPVALAKEDHEKCAGVVKAGHNDCKTDAHSCAGQSKADGGNEWVFLPKGTCSKIVGGSVVN